MKLTMKMMNANMSKKVINYALVVITLLTGIYFFLLSITGEIQQNILNSGLKTILSIIYFTTDTIVVFLFLLYWWSDRKRTGIKRKFKNIK